MPLGAVVANFLNNYEEGEAEAVYRRFEGSASVTGQTGRVIIGGASGSLSITRQEGNIK